MTSGGLIRAGHEILRHHLAAGFRLDALNGRPSGAHGATAPLRHRDGVNTHTLSELRAGHISAGEKGA